MKNNIDLDQTLRFLNLLAGSIPVTYQTYDDDKKKDKKLAKIIHEHAMEREKALQELLHLNKRGAAACWMVNEGDGKGRNDESVLRVRSVFIDLDEGGEEKLKKVRSDSFPPHAIVETSPGKYQVYWKGEIPLAEFTSIQESLSEKFGGDEVKDISRAMRLPGFFHQKKEPFLSRIVTLNEILASYSSNDIRKLAELDGVKPGVKDRKTSQAEWEKILKGVPNGDRNNQAARLIGHYVGKGLSDIEITPILLDWDQRNTPSLGKRVLADTLKSIRKAENKKFEHEASILRELKLTDAGIAEGFNKLHNENVRFMQQPSDAHRSISEGLWIFYNGFKWEKITEAKVRSMILNLIREREMLLIFRPAEDVAAAAVRRELLKRCIGYEQNAKQLGVLNQVKVQANILSDAFDQDEWLLGCKNCVLDLKNGEVKKFTINELTGEADKNYVFKSTSVEYDPAAKCPQWIQFLKDIFLGDDELISFIQKFCGYSLTGNAREEKFLILEGPGANGKSTLLEVIGSICDEYAVPVPFATFKEPKWDSAGNAHQADLVQMIGARFIRSTEVKEWARLNIERIKTLTGNERISGRPAFGKIQIQFNPTGKIWLAVNHLPKIYDTTHSCWRRLLRIPFLYTVPDEKMIQDLSKKLFKEEGAGIFNWMLEGCKKWQEEGLKPIPAAVMKATDEYQEESNPVKRFISENCEMGKFQISCKDLYAAFAAWWAEEMGDGITPLSKKSVGRELKRQGIGVIIIANVKYYDELREKQGAI